MTVTRYGSVYLDTREKKWWSKISTTDPTVVMSKWCLEKHTKYGLFLIGVDNTDYYYGNKHLIGSTAPVVYQVQKNLMTHSAMIIIKICVSDGPRCGEYIHMVSSGGSYGNVGGSQSYQELRDIGQLTMAELAVLEISQELSNMPNFFRMVLNNSTKSESIGEILRLRYIPTYGGTLYDNVNVFYIHVQMSNEEFLDYQNELTCFKPNEEIQSVICLSRDDITNLLKKSKSSGISAHHMYASAHVLGIPYKINKLHAKTILSFNL